MLIVKLQHARKRAAVDGAHVDLTTWAPSNGSALTKSMVVVGLAAVGVNEDDVIGTRSVELVFKGEGQGKIR